MSDLIILVCVLFVLYSWFCLISKTPAKKEEKRDLLNKELNEKIDKVKYQNKLKQVRLKIKELNESNVTEQIASQIAGQIVVQLAEQMVEDDKETGKLDELYSENN